MALKAFERVANGVQTGFKLLERILNGVQIDRQPFESFSNGVPIPFQHDFRNGREPVTPS